MTELSGSTFGIPFPIHILDKIRNNLDAKKISHFICLDNQILIIQIPFNSGFEYCCFEPGCHLGWLNHDEYQKKKMRNFGLIAILINGKGEAGSFDKTLEMVTQKDSEYHENVDL